MDRNHDSPQNWFKATTGALTALAVVAVGLRLLARYEKKQKLWWDDWMIIWSLAWNLLVVLFVLLMTQYGMGLHADTIPAENVVMIAKLLVVAEILYVFNLVWTKISLLLMYYRIFHFPFFKKWTLVIGTVVVLWVIGVTFLFIFICVPVQKLWYPHLEGRCINQVGTWIANAVSTIATDFAILLLPIPQVWKLHLRTIEKVAVTITFLLGSCVIFASTYRFTVLFSYVPADSSYTLTLTVGWTMVEMSAGIVSACLPTLRPAFHFIARKLGVRIPNVLSQPTTTLASSDITIPKCVTAVEAGRGVGMGTGPSDEYLVSCEPGTNQSSESLGRDAVPLHSIRVQKDFEWRDI